MSAMPERGGEGNVAKGGNNPEKGGNECHVQGATVTIPEYIFIVPGFLGWTHLPDADGASVPYVPESRLLAAEARVREVEEQASRPVPLDYGRHPITDARRDFIHHALTYPGFVGNRDLFVEAARDLAAEAATLRADLKAAQELEQLHLQNLDAAYAERDALVELVRDVACSGVAFEDKRLDYVEIQIDTDTWAQARAILAREAGE